MGIGPYSGYFTSFPEISAVCDGFVGVFLNQNVMENKRERRADWMLLHLATSTLLCIPVHSMK